MQQVKNNKLINETEKSLKKGPVIRKKGIKANNITGILQKTNLSITDLKIIADLTFFTIKIASLIK